MDNSPVTVEIESNLPQAQKALEYAIRQWAKNTGGEMVNLTHRDSAEGGTPVDTGRLRNSMTYATSADNRTVYIGTNVEYAKYVEEGAQGRKGAHMLRSAVMDEKESAAKFLKKVLEDNNEV